MCRSRFKSNQLRRLRNALSRRASLFDGRLRAQLRPRSHELFRRLYRLAQRCRQLRDLRDGVLGRADLFQRRLRLYTRCKPGGM